MAVVRSASLRGFAALVLDLGGDPVRIARRVALPLEALSSDDVLIPDDGPALAMEMAARDLGCPDFGFRLSDAQDISGLGPLAIALQNSSTLGEALACAQRHLGHHHQGSTVTAQPDPQGDHGVLALRFSTGLRGTSFPQAAENALLNLHRVVLILAGGDYGLRSVEIGHGRVAPAARYREVFGGVRVNFEQPTSLLRIPAALTRRSIATAQSALREVVEFYLAQHPGPAGSVVSTRVRSVVNALLGTGNVGLPQVAGAMQVPPRTLQRRLADERTSLSVVVDEVRRDTAVRLLASPELTMTDIAAMLDLADQATFTRAARRWWGITPTAKRRLLV